MLAVTAANIVYSEAPIFDVASEHSEWYLTNDASNVGFQFHTFLVERWFS